MGFTTPCFIRKNTKELRDKLENIGYKNCIAEEGPYIFTLSGIFDCMHSECGLSNMAYNGLIDCGKNEELFLAIAALRDDTDCNQWFWYKDKLFKCLGGGSTMLMNGDHSIKLENKPGYFDVMKSKLKKATVKELIEHFK